MHVVPRYWGLELQMRSHLGKGFIFFFIKNNNMWKLIFCSFQKQASGTKEINHSKSALKLQFQYRDKSNKMNDMNNYPIFYLQVLVCFWASILILMCLCCRKQEVFSDQTCVRAGRSLPGKGGTQSWPGAAADSGPRKPEKESGWWSPGGACWGKTPT